MKAALLTLAALAASVAAQPKHAGHRHQHPNKRDDVVYKTEIVTATAPAAIVYVDQNGNPINAPAASSSAAPPVYQAPAASSSAALPVYQPPAASSSSAAAPAQTSKSASSGSGSASGFGIAYSPYNADGTCKDAAAVAADIAKMGGYSLIRLYGTDCGQVANVIAAIKGTDAKLFLGVFDIAQVASEIAIIIEAAKSNWAVVDTISIGNELVNGGTAASAVIAAISTARGLLSAAGYTGSVVTVDTFNAIIANPSLCQASDYAAANCHAFFDSTSTASGAGDYVSEQAARVKEACGGKKVVITESGWPWNGDANGAAIPSIPNQVTALNSIKSKFVNGGVILFSAFDDGWKKNWEGSFNCEQFWGFLNHL